MPRTVRSLCLLLGLAVLATGVVACGSHGVQTAEIQPDLRRGADLFAERCAGCHTLDIAGTEGSAIHPNDREYKDGPNFNERSETREQVLYAIRNGGYSSGPMPQDIVVGEDAVAVADFVAKYAGTEDLEVQPESDPPGSPPPAGDDPSSGP